MNEDDAKTRILPAAPAGELPVGATLSQGMYRVTGRIAAGGFGITYEARDNLNRKVAIKECFPAGLALRSGDFTVSAASISTAEPFETARTLFLREARTLAALRHPNIVHVQTLFEENGTAYMAMDYIEGRDLQHVIAHEPDLLTPDYIMQMTRALLAALEYLHRDAPDRGKERLLHRDIKPANIRIDPLDTPVVIDFGAARQETKNRSRAAGTFRVVSDGYSPNEFYVAGTEQGPASDLYSLAATLHHCIAGVAPAPADERAQKVSNGEADPYEPITGRFPGHDPRLLALIDRALARPLRDRPENAAAWLAAIPDATTRIIPPAPLASPASRPSRGTFWKGAAVGGVALAALGGAGLAMTGLMMPTLNGSNTANAELRNELDAARASMNRLEENLSQVSSTADALQEDVDRVTDARDLAQMRAQELGETVDNLRQRLRSAVAVDPDMESERAAALIAREAADRAADRARADMERMAANLAEAEAEADRLNVELRAARAEVSLAAAGAAVPNPGTSTPPQVVTVACPTWSTEGDVLRFTGTEVYTPQALITQAGTSANLSACTDLPSDTTGFANTVPNYTIYLSEMAQFRRVQMQVTSECNTTLLVNSHDTIWHFDDDSNGGVLPLLNVTGQQAIEGRLDVWIGTIDGITCPATLHLGSWLN